MRQQQPYRIVVLLTCMMAVLLSAMGGSAVASEVYTWTDANGVVHYGDVSPDGQKVQIIDLRITHRPATTEAYSNPGDTQPDPASEAIIKKDADRQETSPPRSAADARREKIAKHRKERREAQAAMDRKCTKHRERLASTEPHRRVFYTDESGEPVRMDDDERIALVEESRVFIAKNCD
ncbi:MAG: DUF4124 domain-containing protein [Xanthomonadales bacterium]